MCPQWMMVSRFAASHAPIPATFRSLRSPPLRQGVDPTHPQGRPAGSWAVSHSVSIGLRTSKTGLPSRAALNPSESVDTMMASQAASWSKYRPRCLAVAHL